MKEVRYAITVPVNTSVDLQEKHKQGEKLLKEALNNGCKVTHITSVAIGNNMFVYHYLEKEDE